MTKHETDDIPERAVSAAANGHSMAFVGSVVNILHLDCGNAAPADFLSAAAFMEKLTGNANQNGGKQWQTLKFPNGEC